jgi:glycosyltransferase involved in cell wall biosynthesis
MNSPKISIVIPSYNKGRFIRETFESIFDQKYSNLEVIVQDGGSTDGTLEIIKSFAKKYPDKIKWESKKDNGQLDAINKGLSKATGKIFTFINADDVYSNEAFNEVGNAYFKKSGAFWFAGEGIIINGHGREIAKFWTWCKTILLHLNSYSLLLATSNYLVQPSVFFTKETFVKYGPFTGTGKYVFEYEMWLKIGRESMPVVIPKKLSSFRSGGVNMSSAFAGSLFAMDMRIARKYSGNSLVVFLHWINNNVRLLVNKFV